MSLYKGRNRIAGDGIDGFSPTVSLTKEDNVATISVTDVEGTKSININEGSTYSVATTTSDGLMSKDDKVYLNYFVSNIRTPTPANQVSKFTTPGTYTWTCPDNVLTVSVLLQSGSPAGYSVRYMCTSSSSYICMFVGRGRSGNVTLYKNISVVPGTTYTIIVGAGGAAATIPSDSNVSISNNKGIAANSGSNGSASTAFGYSSESSYTFYYTRKYTYGIDSSSDANSTMENKANEKGTLYGTTENPYYAVGTYSIDNSPAGYHYSGTGKVNRTFTQAGLSGSVEIYY